MPQKNNPQAVDNLWIIWARYVYLSNQAFVSQYNMPYMNG